jgi:RNA polymerase sigma-70 factor (ECF subfamily)
VVQETFLHLWRTAGRYDAARGRAVAFLFKIAHSRAVDLLRRPSSRPIPTEPALMEDTAAQPDAAVAVESRMVLAQALAALSEPHREVLLWSYHRDLTQAEIAGVLDIPLGTVKTRSHYALRALKLALAERGIHA